MKKLTCKKCGKSRDVGRRLCISCYKEYKREYMKGRPRYMFRKKCEACDKEYAAFRKQQRLCPSCYRSSRIKLKKATNSYVWRGDLGKWEHRFIAEVSLGRKLKCHEVVHHIDENVKNNEACNLLVMSRSMHGKLHQYLDIQRAILEKSKIENIENCWNNLRASMTTAWLEMTGAKVIKIWKIGQSAAEHLLNDGEGSETMYDAPVTGEAVGDDIVQTTTLEDGM